MTKNPAVPDDRPGEPDEGELLREALEGVAPLRKRDLQIELNTLLSAVAPDDLEQRMERLRQFAMSNKLRVAAADITGVISLMVVSDYLTDIAETVTERG